MLMLMAGEKISAAFSKCVFFLLAFFASDILLSEIMGLVWFNPFLAFALSIAAAWALLKKFYSDSFSIPASIAIPALLLIAMLSYPVLLITPFFPASADATTSTASRIILDKMPLTFAPYAQFNVGYPLGYAFLVNSFSRIFPIIPDYLWSWALGIVFGIFQLFGVYLFLLVFFKDKGVAWWGSLLFLGTKLVFENLYVGEYAWLAASAYLLFTLYFMFSRSKMYLLTFPAIFALHPAIALNALIFIAVLRVFYPKIPDIRGLAISLLLAVPAFFMSYLPIAYNLLLGTAAKDPSSGTLLDLMLYYLTILPPWAGLVPFILMLVLAALVILGKTGLSRERLALFAAGLTGLACYLAFGALSLMIVGRVVEVVLLSSLFLAASAMHSLFGLSRFHSGTRGFAIASAAIILLCIAVFSSSSILSHYRGGSKITPEQARFAEAFRKFDPSPQKAIILSNTSGKIAEFSNKVPFDLYSGHTLSHVQLLYYDRNAAQKIKGTSEVNTSIIDGSCVDCLNRIDARYIVTDPVHFSGTLPYPVAFSYGGFVVYRK